MAPAVVLPAAGGGRALKTGRIIQLSGLPIASQQSRNSTRYCTFAGLESAMRRCPRLMPLDEGHVVRVSAVHLCEMYMKTSTKHTHRQHDNVHTSPLLEISHTFTQIPGPNTITPTFTPPALGSLGRARPDVIPRSRTPLEDHPQAPAGAWAGGVALCRDPLPHSHG